MSVVRYEQDDAVASITMDDGKANVLSFAMFDELGAALDHAEAAGAVVVLSGRPGRFSGGFELEVLTSFTPDAAELLRAGFELSYRLLSFPRPVVIACTGHAYAMGAFLVLSGDHRIGVAGSPHRITANEVAIGMTLPRAAIEICRQRLTRAHFERATILAEIFDPVAAVEAGWLDEVVPEADLPEAALARARSLASLDAAAHAATKLRCRGNMLATLRVAIEEDVDEFMSVIAGMA